MSQRITTDNPDEGVDLQGVKIIEHFDSLGRCILEIDISANGMLKGYCIYRYSADGKRTERKAFGVDGKFKFSLIGECVSGTHQSLGLIETKDENWTL